METVPVNGPWFSEKGDKPLRKQWEGGSGRLHDGELCLLWSLGTERGNGWTTERRELDTGGTREPLEN